LDGVTKYSPERHHFGEKAAVPGFPLVEGSRKVDRAIYHNDMPAEDGG